MDGWCTHGSSWCLDAWCHAGAAICVPRQTASEQDPPKMSTIKHLRAISDEYKSGKVFPLHSILFLLSCVDLLGVSEPLLLLPCLLGSGVSQPLLRVLPCKLGSAVDRLSHDQELGKGTYGVALTSSRTITQDPSD